MFQKRLCNNGTGIFIEHAFMYEHVFSKNKLSVLDLIRIFEKLLLTFKPLQVLFFSPPPSTL